MEKEGHVWIRLWGKTWGDVEAGEEGKRQLILSFNPMDQENGAAAGGLEKAEGLILIMWRSWYDLQIEYKPQLSFLKEDFILYW